MPPDLKCQATTNVLIECAPVGGKDVGGQQSSQKAACIEPFVKGVLLHCESSNGIDVNKPLLPK